MGYIIYELGARVHINRHSFSLALTAIKSLHGRETCGRSDEMHFMWINESASFLNAATLDEALFAWRWPVTDVDEDGNIVELEFRGEKYGDEDLLFAAIAPFVEPNSEIRMAGEDGTLWRWLFADGKVQKEFGRLVFDERARKLALAEGIIGKWPHCE